MEPLQNTRLDLWLKGFSQVERLNYGETFFHVMKITSLHIIITLTSIYDYHTHQMDIQTTFLHGHFNEEIFMQQPPGYVIVAQKTKVCQLLKTLYGLKHNLHMWYEQFTSHLLHIGYNECNGNPNVYI
jgi:hypothetical protein